MIQLKLYNWFGSNNVNGLGGSRQVIAVDLMHFGLGGSTTHVWAKQTDEQTVCMSRLMLTEKRLVHRQCYV